MCLCVSYFMLTALAPDKVLQSLQPAPSSAAAQHTSGVGGVANGVGSGGDVNGGGPAGAKVEVEESGKEESGKEEVTV